MLTTLRGHKMKPDHDSNILILEPEVEATATVIWLHGLGADGYDFYSIVPRFNLSSPLSVRFIFRMHRLDR